MNIQGSATTADCQIYNPEEMKFEGFTANESTTGVCYGADTASFSYGGYLNDYNYDRLNMKIKLPATGTTYRYACQYTRKVGESVNGKILQ